MSTINYKHESNCNISENPCEICRVLNREEYSVVEKTVDTKQTTITLKKVRSEINGMITDSYPTTSVDESFVENHCVQALLKSCTPLGERSEEIVSVVNIDSSNGEITMSRKNPVPHTGELAIDFNVISPEMINTYAKVLCELYESYCGNFPPYASTVNVGIGLASAVSQENQGTAPTFITTDDPNWQSFLADNGGGIGSSTMESIINYLGTTTACSGQSQTNLKVLEDLLSITCGKESCLNNLLTALCGVFDTIIEDGNTTGIKIKERFLKVDHGVSKIILHSNERHGNFDLVGTAAFEPVADSSDNPLVVDFTGQTSVNGVTVVKTYDQVNVVLPRRGELIINGNLTSKWEDGATQGTIEIKQGTVTIATYETFRNDSRVESNNNIHIKTNPLLAGNYSIAYNITFALPKGAESLNTASVYSYSHTTEFNPTF